MTPDEYAVALEVLGYSPEIARTPIPEIREGDDAEARDYHLVHQEDGRVAIGLPSDRSNKTWIVTWNDAPAVFATADEARAVIIELIKRKKAIYGRWPLTGNFAAPPGSQRESLVLPPDRLGSQPAVFATRTRHVA